MSLPNTQELLSLFSSYLSESGLSNVSIKNYVSDLRHFLKFCEVYSASHSEFAQSSGVEETFKNINLYLKPYTDNQKATFTPNSTTNRRLASIRRFATFLSVKFYLPNVFTEQTPSQQIIQNKIISGIENFITSDQNISSSPSIVEDKSKTTGPGTQVLSTAKILEQFKNSLEREKKTHSTVKNYLSDLNHFFLWTANQTPFSVQNLQTILSENQLQAYITYLKLSHTSTSVINRRQSSIKKLAKFCFTEGYLPENPFELKAAAPTLSPLAWIERLSRKPKKVSNAPKNRFVRWYDRYTALPWTPYLNIALLILLTTGMAIFAYNQIISQARPSAAATALTPPRRQLSFQGRLTDSSGTPITTAVTVEFRLFDQQAPGGSQLYTTNACSITPDQDGIFNTLIGDGTCGAEIPINVFTDNRDVFLEIQVGAETLTPRQQIATVGFALNSETLQGYPASAAATINTVPVIDNNGDINIAVTSPSIISSDGTFSIIGQSVAIQTAANSGGDVILQPDALGSGQILAIGGTTDTDSFRITNANLTTGALLSGYVGNDLPNGRLISLTSGSTETDRFWVATDGRTSINANATDSALTINQTGTGNLISASVSGSPVFTVTSGGNVDITGQYLINGVPLDTSSGGYWQRVDGALSPVAITDSINLGNTATTSALVHLAGTAGDESFINTGNFGIGTNNPSTTLQVNSPNALATQIGGAANSYLQISDLSGNDVILQSFASPFGARAGTLSNTKFTLIANNTVGLTVDTNGNVGINEQSPSEKLDVDGNVTFTQALMPAGDAGDSGEILVSQGAGVAPIWTSTVPATSVPFSGITSATNTVAAMVVGTGASLNFTGSGTINASTLLGATWASPAAIGSGTPNSGAFTTLTASGLLSANGGLSVSGYATVSASLAVGYTSAPEGPGHGIFSGRVGIGDDTPDYELDVVGSLSLTGAFRDSTDSPGTSGQLLSSTATGTDWIDVSSVNFWQRNGGALAPLNISDALLIGGNSTASAYFHIAGTAGDNSWINNGNFGINDTTPGFDLDINGDMNLTGALNDNGNPGLPGQILSSTGTGVEWIDNVATSSGQGDSLWTTANGAIYPINATWDAFVGGDSTASAAFAFMNVSAGVPTASISSTTTNVNTYLTGDGTLATTNRQTLTVGNSSTYDTTGNVVINSNGTGSVGIGNASPDRKLEVTDAASPQLRLTQTDSTVYADFHVNTNGDLVIGVDGISNQLVLDNSGSIGMGTAAPGGRLHVAADTNSAIRISGADGTSNVLNISGNNLIDTASPSIRSDGTSLVFNGNNAGGNLYFNLDSGAHSIFSNNVGIGDASPLSALTVGDGDDFQVNSTGAIIAATGIVSSGTIQFTVLGTGIVHSDSSGTLSSSAVDLASSDVTGILPIIRGGTNNNTYTTNEILIYDGTKIASSGFTTSSFESALTFSNGLTRTLNNVVWGGTLTQATNIDMNGNDITFTGSGNFGIGVASPSGKFDVSGVLVVDAVNGRVGIGTSTPAVALDIAGTTSTISNSAGDITFNSASGSFNYSGDSLDNILNASFSGQLKLGNFPTVGLPTAIGSGALIYDSTIGSPKFWNGASWQNISSFFERTATGILYPSNFYDSINIGGTPSASASALIRLSTNEDFGTFFVNPVAIGFNGNVDAARGFTMLQVGGDILPDTTDAYFLGDAGASPLAWKGIYLSEGIYDDDAGGTQLISTSQKRLTGGAAWNIVDGVRVGDTSNVLGSGIKLHVANGGATISGTLGVVGDSSLIGNVTVGGGTGKIDVGTVDPPYTINGEKYGTYMAGMIGVKEEVMGKIAVNDQIPGVGYRALLDLDGQPKGSDVWLFSKTTNIKENINQLAVLLTAQGQGKTWYELDSQNKILAIYSSTPSDVIYRLTAPRFDAANWSNNRTSASIGFVINDPDSNNNIFGTGLLNASISAPELIAQVDNHYKLVVNGQENREISSFAESMIANLKVGTQVVFNLVADNLTIRTKLVSPIADIDQLKVIDATISGTLYADNIKSKTVDNLTRELDLLNEKYSTASAILSELQNRYSSYDSLLGTINEATISGDPLALSPLATTSAAIPSDLAIDSINVHMILTNDILANGSVLAQSFSSLDTDLFIQPTGDKPVHILANLMTLYPDGKVVINGDLLITGTIYANAIDTRTATVSGTLALGKGELASDSAQLIALFDDNGQIVGSVDASGSANFGKLVTGGLVIAAGNENENATMSATANTNTTIGTATIATGSSEITVATSKVTDHTLIYITPISNTDNNVLFVKSKQAGVGFTVAVPAKANQVSQEISFNYWLVETK